MAVFDPVMLGLREPSVRPGGGRSSISAGNGSCVHPPLPVSVEDTAALQDQRQPSSGFGFRSHVLMSRTSCSERSKRTATFAGRRRLLLNVTRHRRNRKSLQGQGALINLWLLFLNTSRRRQSNDRNEDVGFGTSWGGLLLASSARAQEGFLRHEVGVQGTGFFTKIHSKTEHCNIPRTQAASL